MLAQVYPKCSRPGKKKEDSFGPRSGAQSIVSGEKESAEWHALVSNQSQPQVEDGHGRKKFNTHSGAPINCKAKGEEFSAFLRFRTPFYEFIPYFSSQSLPRFPSFATDPSSPPLTKDPPSNPRKASDPTNSRSFTD
ncbi:hypothetical protein H920_07221 [Fukomys damarensis]|uniref:Uncharacterized protein n=1 Tax=Fukomys damarensis TaxID=885580 RepID=A0A091E8A5_FUKDA|nr:hypothetical protein H920_07221 [Fukomys damarensis]